MFDWFRKTSPADFLSDSAAYDINAHIKFLKRLWKEHKYNTSETALELNAILRGAIAAQFPKHAKHFDITLQFAIIQLLSYNNVTYSSEPTWHHDRYFLTDLQSGLLADTEDVQIGVVALFSELFKRLPVPAPSNISVPIRGLLPMKDTVLMVMQCANEFMPGTNKQIEKNTKEISGIRDDKTSRKIILPDEYDGDPLHYLKGTGLEDFFDREHPFAIPRHRWPTHAVVLAPSEWGKSELTGLFLREALEDPIPRAAIVCDPHGDLYRKALPRVPPERLIAIDLTTDPPDLNILDKRVMSDRAALETFRFMMSSLAGGLSPKQETCIKPLFALLSQIPNANLATLHEIITEQTKRPAKFAAYIAQLGEIHRTFFEMLWYSGNFSETREALVWKISSALDDPTFYKMFSAKTNSLDVSRWLDEKKIVLIKSGNQLDKEGTRLFFLYLVGQYYAAARRRNAIPEDQRELAMMFVDEASIVMQSPIIGEIFTDIRKYKCAFFVAIQLWQHVAENVRPAVLGSTGIRIVGQLGLNEGKAVGPDMGITGEQIKALTNIPAKHAEWYFYVRSVADKGVKLTIPYGVLENMPKQTPKTLTTEEKLLKDIADELLPYAKKALPPFKPGDLVQVHVGGYAQFKNGVKVRKIEHGFVFVEGSETGIPIADVTLFKAPDDDDPVMKKK